MDAPATVLMTADPLGGVFSYALELSAQLGRRGVRVALATMGGQLTPAQRAAASAVAGLSLFESAYRLEWMDDPWDDVARAGTWLLELEQQLRPDVVHLNGYAHGALPFAAPTVVVAHSCVLTWHDAVLGGEPPARLDRYRAEVTRGLAGATAVVAPSRAMLAEVARRYPTSTASPDGAASGPKPQAPAVPLRLIHNGVDPARYGAVAKEEFVMSLGRIWDQAKNMAALGAAAGSLPWPVRVAGSDRHPDGSRRPAASLVDLGVLSPPEVASWLARAAIFALPARYEPFGLSILEAALSGCALVLGDIPSLRELWTGAALFVDPNDPDDLERTLRCLMSHRHLCAALGARGRERGLTYSAERMAEGYLGLYVELLGRSQRRPGPHPQP